MTEQPPTPETPPTPGDIVSDEQQHDEQHDEQQHDEQSGNDDELRQTFDRDYVEQLRSKSAGYRLRAKEAESDRANLQRQLFQERLQRLDLVVDVDAVPYDAELLDDEAALVAHVESLLADKPYLRKRQLGGDIGQHSAGDNPQGVSLLSMMKQNS